METSLTVEIEKYTEQNSRSQDSVRRLEIETLRKQSRISDEIQDFSNKLRRAERYRLMVVFAGFIVALAVPIYLSSPKENLPQLTFDWNIVLLICLGMVAVGMLYTYLRFWLLKQGSHNIRSRSYVRLRTLFTLGSLIATLFAMFAWSRTFTEGFPTLSTGVILIISMLLLLNVLIFLPWIQKRLSSNERIRKKGG